ncbi:MAG: tagaturonate epimerase family protein [Promethearchaeota archaeon]
MKLKRYSIGTGDRFGCQSKAQLKALIKAKEKGVDIDIVWNKSHREHLITKTKPQDVLEGAQNAVRELNWDGNYYVDADHIGFNNVDLFIDSCNFFTIDVAEFIGKNPVNNDIQDFLQRYQKYLGKINIPYIKKNFKISKEFLEITAQKYLLAIKEARKIYNKIKKKKGNDNSVIEISIDESNVPQTPIEMFFILGAIAEEKIPIQTIAPKFYGKFNKGIDYKGNIKKFTKQFEAMLAIIQYAKEQFSLYDNLKLSIHSGSDKFSLYNDIKKCMKKFDVGIHLKTSGTTWLEELIGLAIAGNDGLELVKEIYTKAYYQFNELCKPYAKVINIRKEKLPHPEKLNIWRSESFVKALRHDSSCSDYNPNFRQLLHIGYKIAADMGSRYLNLLKKYEETIAVNVTKNIYENHIEKLFL